MTIITVIPSDFTVVVDGVGYSNQSDWTFTDDFHALQWDGSAGHIEPTDGDENVAVTDYTTQVEPYANWHTRQTSLAESEANCNYSFYTLGPIDDATNTYTKVPRDLATCQTEQEINVVKEAEEKLDDTDIFYVRSEELTADVPTDVQTYRDDVRTTRDDRLAAIAATTTVEELETLVDGFDRFTVKLFGYKRNFDGINYINGINEYRLTQPDVNGTYPWPRILYTRLREA